MRVNPPSRGAWWHAGLRCVRIWDQGLLQKQGRLAHVCAALAVPGVCVCGCRKSDAPSWGVGDYPPTCLPCVCCRQWLRVLCCAMLCCRLCSLKAWGLQRLTGAGSGVACSLLLLLNLLKTCVTHYVGWCCLCSSGVCVISCSCGGGGGGGLRDSAGVCVCVFELG